MGILSSIIGGIANFVGDIANPVVNVVGDLADDLFTNANEGAYAYNSSEAQKSRDYQTSERLASQQWNQEMWNKNNEYNSLSSQIKRATAAGVNPASLIGSGSSSATSTPPTTSAMSGATASAPAGNNLASTLLTAIPQALLSQSQARNLDSQTNLNNQTYDWNAKTEQIRYEQMINGNEEYKARIAKIFSDIGVNDFNKELQSATFEIFKSKSLEEINVMKESLNNLRNQNLEILKNIDLKDAQIKDYFASASLKYKQGQKIDSDIDVNESVIDLNEANTSLTNEKVSGQQIDNSIQNIVKEYSSITGIPIGAPDSHVLFTLWAQGRFSELSDKITLIGRSAPDRSISGQTRQFFSDLSTGLKQDLRTFFPNFLPSYRNNGVYNK